MSCDCHVTFYLCMYVLYVCMCRTCASTHQRTMQTIGYCGSHLKPCRTSLPAPMTQRPSERYCMHTTTHLLYAHCITCTHGSCRVPLISAEPQLIFTKDVCLRCSVCLLTCGMYAHMSILRGPERSSLNAFT